MLFRSFENNQENEKQNEFWQNDSAQNTSQQYTYSNAGQNNGSQSYQQQYQDNYNYNVGNNTGYGTEYQDGMDTTPLSMGEWVLTLLLMAIPCVNIIMCCVWAFGKTGNINRRNFCRAELIFIAIGVVLSIIMGIAMFVTGMSVIGNMGHGSYYYY